MAIDYDQAAGVLADAFKEAERDFRKKREETVSKIASAAILILMESNTQAFREALIGCCLVRHLDQSIDISKPYVNQGADAFNGRTLDERVVNPFLQEAEVPCSKGPYLSALRRNISFIPETEKGLRDKDAFGAMLAVIGELKATNAAGARSILVYLLTQFVELRANSKIVLSKINRLSVDQYRALLAGLLEVKSGGLLPVLIAVAGFESIKATYGLPWDIEWQGINVADAASGAGGDITIKRAGVVVLSVEVTERTIDEDRVRSTFRTKISPNAIDDYLFFFSAAKPTDEARARARAYFAQGHEINFAPIMVWVMTTLSTLGTAGRIKFTETLIHLLDRMEVPASIKVAWNEQVRAVLA